MASQRLALIHVPATYLAAYSITREPHYRDVGEAVLDYLCLYQQSRTNPVLEGLTGDSMLLGGFTTQNSDAESSNADRVWRALYSWTTIAQPGKKNT